MQPLRIGVIGYGFIGSDLVRRVTETEGMEVAFVHNRGSSALTGLDTGLVLPDLADRAALVARKPGLIVEAAHPDISVTWGAGLLEVADYMPTSTTALVDDAVRGAMIESARRHGHRIVLPFGALVGGDALASRPDAWDRVKITFRKNPANLDLAVSGWSADQIDGPTVVFSGSAREVGKRFPRNVNTMVTAALVSVGLDRCECEVVADPSLDVAVAEVEAWGHDGGYLRTDKQQPAVGVSGTELLDTVWYSVRRALRADGDLPLL